MRVNVYAEEMTERVEIIAKVIDGRPFTGLRIYLELPATVNGQQYQGPFMHRPGDDDSSAVTFWGKRDLRVVLRKALDELDKHYAESASPPRVPGASAHPSKVGIQSGPGQPTQSPQNIAELIETVAYERGYRAGIEAAAKYHVAHEAACWAERDAEGALRHEKDAAAIRALADKPAPDAARKGG